MKSRIFIIIQLTDDAGPWAVNISQSSELTNVRMMDFASTSLLNSENADATALFTASISAFRDTLSDADQASWQECANAAMMIKELEALFSAHSQRGKLATCLNKIKAFSDSFEHFDIINKFVQVKPSFWGSIRLIFKVCLHSYSNPSCHLD